MAMTIGQIAARIHKDMCDDAANGYSWSPRWGEDGKGVKTLTIEGREYQYDRGSYECGTSVTTAWKAVLKGTKYEHSLDAYQYTGNLLDVYTGTGLFEKKPMSFLACPGDLYLNIQNHVAMCQTQEPDVLSEFCINENGGVYGGKVGDQTGNESHVTAYYDYPWDCIVHAKQITMDELLGTAKPATKTPTKTTVKKRLNGIDIASYQATLDPAKVSADFVIVKVSGGTSYVNPHWKKHAQAVLESKKLLGLYHYACEYGSEPGGKAEAQFFLEQIKGYEGKAVLCLDWEDHAQQMPVTYAKAWLDTVANATGSTPMFYAYASYLNSRDHSLIRKYPLWMASYLYKYENGTGYVSNPDNTWPTSSWTKMTMYQYASTRTLKGYSGSLDMDVFYGTADDWKKLAKSGTAKQAVVVTQPRYRIFRDGKWQAWHSNGASAGKSGRPIYDIDFSGLPAGSWWRLTLKGGKVLKKGQHNDAHKLPVTGIEVYYKTADPDKTGYHEALYRAHTVAGSWLKWEHDVDDGGAGDDANAIDVLQFKVAKC